MDLPAAESALTQWGKCVAGNVALGYPRQSCFVRAMEYSRHGGSVPQFGYDPREPEWPAIVYVVESVVRELPTAYLAIARDTYVYHPNDAVRGRAKRLRMSVNTLRSRIESIRLAVHMGLKAAFPATLYYEAC